MSMVLNTSMFGNIDKKISGQDQGTDVINCMTGGVGKKDMG